jgi:hypothetical protein
MFTDFGNDRDPRQDGYILKPEDGKFYKYFAETRQVALAQRACWDDNGTVAVPYPAIPRNIVMSMVPAGQFVPAGAYQLYPPDLTWVTFDGLCSAPLI